MCMYTNIYMYVYIHIYIYTGRESIKSDFIQHLYTDHTDFNVPK